MKIHKQTYLIFFVLLSISVMSVGQTTRVIELTNYAMGSSQNTLPFWLWANRDGKVRPDVSFLNMTDFGMNVSGQLNQGSELKYSAGTNIIGTAGNKSYLQINQLFGAIDYKGWKIEAGIFYDRLQFGGLSTSNGNLARSRNARPVPKIRMSTSGYKPVPGLQNWLSFQFEFDEGLLNDERYVDNTHLHHKSLYLQVQPVEKWRIQMGIEHFVMWGGTSRNSEIGELPKGFKEYLRYITGQTGNADSPNLDQNNV